jgi:hypothetical protein
MVRKKEHHEQKIEKCQEKTSQAGSPREGEAQSANGGQEAVISVQGISKDTLFCMKRLYTV